MLRNLCKVCWAGSNYGRKAAADSFWISKLFREWNFNQKWRKLWSVVGVKVCCNILVWKTFWEIYLWFLKDLLWKENLKCFKQNCDSDLSNFYFDSYFSRAANVTQNKPDEDDDENELDDRFMITIEKKCPVGYKKIGQRCMLVLT